jgi:hypothetical protein
MRLAGFGSIVLVFTLVFATEARAQQEDLPWVADVIGGYTAFGDDGIIHHSVIGVSTRTRVSPRVWLGPEVTYMVGPGQDRDLLFTGTAMFDFRRSARVTPYGVVNGGLLQHSGGFSSDAALILSFGGGVRIATTERCSIAPEFRMGFEPHMRMTVSVGCRLGR